MELDELESLRILVTRNPLDAEGWYSIGILCLEECLDETSEARIKEAREALRRSLSLGRTSGWAHAALGYLEELDGDLQSSLSHLRAAHGMDPEERIVETYLLTVLVETGTEQEALAGVERAAIRHNVDIDSLRQQLEAVGFPVNARTLLANGFLHPHNFFESWLRDEADRVREAIVPGRLRREMEEEGRVCRELQAQLTGAFHMERVPEGCVPLGIWAARLGIGDDPCRRHLFEALTEEDRVAIRHAVEVHGGRVNEWLDTFAAGTMTDEAAALMYLLLGVEDGLLGNPSSGPHDG